MKKPTITILLIFIFATAKPSIYGEYIWGHILVGFATVPLWDMTWHNYDRPEDGLYIAPGVDPKHALQGKIDLTTKLYYRIDRIEPFVSYETFPDIKYQGLSVGVNYAIINKKLSLLAGPEATRIWNENGEKLYKAFSVGINTEIRYFISKRFSFSINGNLKTRPEISKPVVPSVTTLINIKIL